MSKAPSFKPEGLSSLPVSPGPELVTVVRGLRGYDGPSHGRPGRGFHCASVGGVVPLRPRRVTTRLRRSGDVATAVVCVCGCVCVCVCMCMCMCMYVYIYIYPSMYMYIYIYTPKS